MGVSRELLSFPGPGSPVPSTAQVDGARGAEAGSDYLALAAARLYSANVHQLRREVHETRRVAEELLQDSEQGVTGWALAHQAQWSEGVA